ncbi:PAS domain-containing protein [Microvirga sp. GCM10011540]|uniref:PAS domain-containing protein n=1 Tax=Microvirga sp. GCM10011540 TaxID=3317338 RepID=UPI00361758D5
MLAKSSSSETDVRQEIDIGADGAFQTALRSLRTAVVMTDPRQADDPIVFVNDAFSRMTGYPAEEVVGLNCRFLQGPGTDPATVAAIDAALRAGEGIETEVLNYRKDGSPFWNALAISPVHDRDGNLRHFISLQSDITAKKEAELELARTKADLEERIENQILDLQSALDQKTALLHEVEHRVKNNLQVISSIVLLKARRLKSPESRRVLQELAERISALSTVHRLLYTSGDVSRFDFAAFTHELIPELSAGLPLGQVELDLDVEPVSVSAAKAASLALLLNELVGNAVKHAFPEGRKGTLTIEIGKTEKGLELAVADDGVGFDGAVLHEGGLGRTLIDMLVRQLKGHLTWLDTKPGLRVEIVVPLDAEEIQFES